MNRISPYMNRIVVYLLIGLIVGGAGGYGVSYFTGTDTEEANYDEERERTINEMSRLRDEMMTTGESLDAALNEVTILQTEVSSLHEKEIQLVQTQKSILEVQTQLDEISQELSQKSTELSQKSIELSQRSNDLSQLTSELSEARADLHRANEELRISANRIAEMQGKINKLKAVTEHALTLELEPIELVDSMGNPASLEVGRLIVIQSKVTNISNERATFTFLAQVMDASDNSMVFEQYLINLQVNPGDSLTPGISWSPSRVGTYRIEVYAVDGLANKIPLSLTQTTLVTLD